MRSLCWTAVVIALCTASLGRAADELPVHRPRIAVADFKVVGDVGIQDAGKAVAELLLTRFSTEKYQLVERSHLATLLKEQKLTMAEIVSNPALLKGGKLKGVKYLVLGSVVRLGNLAISARLVDVHSGDIAQTADSSAEDALGLQVSLAEVAKVLQMTGKEKREYVARRGRGLATDAGARRRAAALSRVLAMAPAKTNAVFHLEVAAIRKPLLDALRQPNVGLSKPLWQVLNDISTRLVYVDYFAAGGTSLLGVFRGALTIDDVRAVHRANAEQAEQLKVVARGNGRYEIGTAGDIVIVGKEAGDVPDDVVILADKQHVTEGLLATLGKGDTPALRESLRGVDTSGVFWGAMPRPATEADAQVAASDPTHVAFWFKSGKGREQACMRFTFASAKTAAEELVKMRADKDKASRAARAFFNTISREGQVITCLATSNECIIPKALSFLTQMTESSGKDDAAPAKEPTP